MDENDNQTVDAKEAFDTLWHQNNLTFLLDDNQKELFSIYKKAPKKIIVWNLARGCGKSYLLCVISIYECLRRKNTLIKYACPTQTQARQIMEQVMQTILETCPLDLKPEYKVNEHSYRFNNGSQIQLSALDSGKAERLRGGSARLAIIDEAAAVKGATGKGDLKYIIKSILIPAITRHKAINGKLILASTPPENPDHPFVDYLRKAHYEQTLSTKTIYDCPRYTSEMIADLIENMDGENSPDFRREYLCEIVRNSDVTVLPEFNQELQNRICKEWPRPPFFHTYVAMDIGVSDLTFVIFAYYDFKASKLIIEDEYILSGKGFNTKVLADYIKFKEIQLWTKPDTTDVNTPYKRICDNNLILVNDLLQLHNLLFEPTRKDEKLMALSNLRIMLNAEQIIINPKCVNLIRHLRDARWNRNRSDFTRSVDNGHYDGVAALMYLVRNIDITANPYPPGYGVPFGENYYQYRQKPDNMTAYAIKTMLNIKNK